MMAGCCCGEIEPDLCTRCTDGDNTGGTAVITMTTPGACNDETPECERVEGTYDFLISSHTVDICNWQWERIIDGANDVNLSLSYDTSEDAFCARARLFGTLPTIVFGDPADGCWTGGSRKEVDVTCNDNGTITASFTLEGLNFVRDCDGCTASVTISAP